SRRSSSQIEERTRCARHDAHFGRQQGRNRKATAHESGSVLRFLSRDLTEAGNGANKPWTIQSSANPARIQLSFGLQHSTIVPASSNAWLWPSRPIATSIPLRHSWILYYRRTAF